MVFKLPDSELVERLLLKPVFSVTCRDVLLLADHIFRRSVLSHP